MFSKVFFLFALCFLSCKAINYTDPSETYTLNGKISSSNERTIISDTEDISYRVCAYNESTQTIDAETFCSYLDPSFCISLKKGSYTLKVYGSIKDLSFYSFYGETSVYINEISARASCSISMSKVEDNCGYINIPCTVSDDSSVSYMIATLNNEAEVLRQTITFDNSNSSYINFNSERIPEGNYDLKISFYSSMDNLLYYITEACQVSSCLVSNNLINDASYIKDKGIYISKELIEAFSNRGSALCFYVMDKIGDYIPDGSFYRPYTTLQEAIDAILSINDSISQYIIYLKNSFNIERTENFDSTKNYALMTINNSNTSKNLDIVLQPFQGKKFSVDLNSENKYIGRFLRIIGDSTNTCKTKITINDMTFSNGYLEGNDNDSKDGCIMGGLIYSTDSDIYINSCKFNSSNILTSDWYYNEDENPVSNIFSGIYNFSVKEGYNGMGAFICGSGQGSLNIYGSNFTSCKAGIGGAISIDGLNVNISNCNFYNCEALESGALDLQNCNNATIKDSYFDNCSAKIISGTIYASKIQRFIMTSCIFSGCSLESNSSRRNMVISDSGYYTEGVIGGIDISGGSTDGSSSNEKDNSTGIEYLNSWEISLDE